MDLLSSLLGSVGALLGSVHCRGPAQLSRLPWTCSALWADMDMLGSVGALLGSVHCHGPAQLSRLTYTCSVQYIAVDVLSSLGCHGSDRLNTSRAGGAQYVAMGLLGAVGALLSSVRCHGMDLLGSVRCPRRA